jgi:putative membrane protein
MDDMRDRGRKRAMKGVVTAVSAVTLMFVSNLAQARSPDSAADRAFIQDAIQGDLAEVQVGKLAQERGESEQVKQFGQRLERDHGANLEKAKPLAESMGVTLPTAPNAEQKATYDELSGLSGVQFDRQFAKKMVQDHKKDIKAFEHATRGTGTTADFAKQTLPTLREHLKIARSLGGSKT